MCQIATNHTMLAIETYFFSTPQMQANVESGESHGTASFCSLSRTQFPRGQINPKILSLLS
jgi:hypothetical protein